MTAGVKKKLKMQKNLIDIVWCGKRALLFIFMMLSSTFTKQLTKVLKDKMKKWMWILDNRLFISATYYLLAEII